jgi:hypothetical protein
VAAAAHHAAVTDNHLGQRITCSFDDCANSDRKLPVRSSLAIKPAIQALRCADMRLLMAAMPRL